MKIPTFLLGTVLAASAAKPAADDSIQITVGPGTDVEILIPHMAPADLRTVLAALVSKGDEAKRKEFENVFKKTSNITVILTTKHGAEWKKQKGE